MSSAETLDAMVSAATPAEMPKLAGELAKALAAVLVRAATPVATVASTPMVADLLTIEEAAMRLGIPKSCPYLHSKNC